MDIKIKFITFFFLFERSFYSSLLIFLLLLFVIIPPNIHRSKMRIFRWERNAKERSWSGNNNLNEMRNLFLGFHRFLLSLLCNQFRLSSSKARAPKEKRKKLSPSSFENERKKKRAKKRKKKERKEEDEEEKYFHFPLTFLLRMCNRHDVKEIHWR